MFGLSTTLLVDSPLRGFLSLSMVMWRTVQYMGRFLCDGTPTRNGIVSVRLILDRLGSSILSDNSF